MDWLSWLFPKRCGGCGRVGEYVCAECLNLIQVMNESYCPVCRKPSILGKTHVKCLKEPSLDGLISGYKYQGLMKKIITKFKYKFVKDLNETLIELWISNINSTKFLENSWVLVPVPLHKNRKKWRGFNQAEILALGLAKAWGWSYQPELMERVIDTKTQMGLTGKSRKFNLKGAFTVKKEESMPQKVMLVDDVATTCSTLLECANTLKKAGVKEVWGLTLAQAIPRV